MVRVCAAPRGTVQRSPGKKSRLVGRSPQSGIGDQILVAENQQQGGKRGYGKGRLKPAQPPLPLNPGLAGTGRGGGRQGAGQLWQLGFGLPYKCGSGAKIKGALGAIEEVLLEGLARIRRQLIQKITLRSHLLYSFAVIHLLNPHCGPTSNSGRGRQIVSNLSGICAQGHRIAEALNVLRLEFLLGPMQQNPQIVAFHAKLPADFVAIALVKKDSLQQQPVARGQVKQNLPDFILDLPGDLPGNHHLQRIGAIGQQLGLSFHIQRLAAAGGAVMLKQHVIANLINKGAEALRLAQAAVLAQYRQDTGQGLLSHILDGLRGLEPGAELKLEQFRKIAGKVLLRPGVAGTETFNITCVE